MSRKGMVRLDAESNDPELRSELSRIMRDFDVDQVEFDMDDIDERIEPVHRLLTQQVVEINRLFQRFHHSILRMYDPAFAHESMEDFNNFLYVFPVACKAFINYEFVQYLLDHKLKEIGPSEAKTGTVIIYFGQGRIVHAGKIDRGRVVSKWHFGCLWNHRIFEVPEQYGDNVRFFRPISQLAVAATVTEFILSYFASLEK